ncbi:MAG TPA: molybdate ABC transporter substrate-binding protein [Terrimicrobium sp.]
MKNSTERSTNRIRRSSEIDYRRVRESVRADQQWGAIRRLSFGGYALPAGADQGGLGVARISHLYAIGHLVVWTASDAVDISSGIQSLAAPRIRKVAIANPEHAPYGRAAKAALAYFDAWDTVQGKLVFGENIAQAAHFVETGNADAGSVALSIVLAPSLSSKGRWIEVPNHAYSPLEQGAVVTRNGAANPAAQVYIEFLRSADARTIFDRFGFRLPE